MLEDARAEPRAAHRGVGGDAGDGGGGGGRAGPRAAAPRLVLLSFRERFTSMDAIPFILPEPGLSALEIVDSRVLQGARELFEFRATAALVAPDALGVLFCEFSRRDARKRWRSSRTTSRAARRRCPGNPVAGVYLAPQEQIAAWALRQAATGLLYRTTAHRDIKPQEFVEDTGIAPEKLGAYTRRFEEIVHRNGTTLGFFGHAGQGCLHIRVDLNLKRGEDVERMQSIAQRGRGAGGGVRRLALAASTATGSRGREFLPLMFGPEIMELHREVKHVFDPENRMNPGKIVPPVQRMSRESALRRGVPRRSAARPSSTTRTTAGGTRRWRSATGWRVCRKLDAGTMCPSFMVTLEEEHSTRGRANSLREAMRGNLPGMKSEEVLEALDLCLELQGVQDGVPGGRGHGALQVGVPGAAPPRHGHAPASAHFFGRIHESRRPAPSRRGSPTSATGCCRAAHQGRCRTSTRAASCPELAPAALPPQGGRRRRGSAAATTGRRSILFDDTFHNYFGTGPLQAAVTVLERAGFTVELPQKQVCCGRPMISKGLLDDARDLHAEPAGRAGARGGARRADRGHGAELHPHPARRAAGPGARRPRAKALAENSFTLEEFLAEPAGLPPGRLERRAIVHGHCHQKALIGMEPTRQVLESVEGLEFRSWTRDAAGWRGRSATRRATTRSPGGGERVLFPAVRGRRRTISSSPPASPAATRSPTSATAAAPAHRRASGDGGVSMYEIFSIPADAAEAPEQMGTKRKFWFRHPDLGMCLFKLARPDTGEDWSEKVACEVAGLLGLPHARYEMAEWKGAPGSLSVSMLAEGEALIHGNELIAEASRMSTPIQKPNHAPATWDIRCRSCCEHSMKVERDRPLAPTFRMGSRRQWTCLPGTCSWTH